MEYGRMTEAITATSHQKAVVVVASIVAYLAAFFPVYHVAGGTAVALAILVAVAAGYAFGLWAGVVSGIAVFPVNMLLLVVAEESGWMLMMHQGLLGSLIIVAIGAVVGRLSDVQEHVRETKERYRWLSRFHGEVLEHSPTGIMRLDEDLHIVYENPEMEELMGVPAGEESNAIGVDIRELASVQKAGVADVFDRLSEGEEIQGELHFVSIYGKETYLSFRGAPVMEDNTFTGAVVLINDVTERKKLEEKCMAERDRAKNYLETAEVMMVGINRDGMVIQANRKASEVLGYCRENIIGKNWFENFLPERYRDEVQKVHSRVIRDDEYPKKYENPVLTKSGEERVIAWYNSILKSEGEIIGTLSSGMDITERKKAQRELRESEEKYRAIVENSHDGIYIYRGTEFLFINDRVAEITGYSKQELYDMNPFELFHPDDRERVEDIGRRRARGEDVPNTYQARVISKQGAVKYCEFAVTPITYKGEYAALGSVRDITRQKMAEEGLRQSEEEKTLILDTSPALIAYQDTSHRVIWANRAAAESVGETPEELEGRRCYEIWHQRDEPCEGCPVEQAIETGEMQEGEITSPDGRHWLIRGSPVRDEEGNIVGAVETTLDITERKQAEQEMERALEQEKVFKLKTAHHFFNPIAISKGYMDIAREELPDGQKKLIQRARDAIMRIQRVVENVVERGEIHE